MASYLYRTAQPPILAAFLPWGGSAGAGRIRLAGAKVSRFHEKIKHFARKMEILFLFTLPGIMAGHS
jgi:hypothetical protein